MDKNNIIKFIEKAIDKTKNRELSWSLLSQGYTVKPLSNEDDRSLISTMIYSNHLLKEHSYSAHYKMGEILLLVYPETPNHTVFYPPNNCHISLRMQDQNDKHSVEIANSDHSIEINSALIRLYNLIDKRSLSVNALIEDFLNS